MLNRGYSVPSASGDEAALAGVSKNSSCLRLCVKDSRRRMVCANTLSRACY